jgi:hypothetical protein
LPVRNYYLYFVSISQVLREEERKQAEEKRKEKELMEYRDFMDPDKMVTNQSGVNLEDDFW